MFLRTYIISIYLINLSCVLKNYSEYYECIASVIETIDLLQCCKQMYFELFMKLKIVVTRSLSQTGHTLI